jgi:uncharacterized protein (TIGR03083 family)
VIEHLADAVDRMRLAIASTDPEATAPSCPGWTAGDVAKHLGGVHLWAVKALSSTKSPGGKYPERPIGEEPLSDWYAGCAATLLDALKATPPSQPAWTFYEADRSAGFWARRQVHETTIHRIDVEQAAGRSHDNGIDGFSTELAADGIGEVLTVMMSRTLARRRTLSPEQVLPVPRRVAIVCPDAGRAWTVQLVEDRLVVTDGAHDPVATISGSAAHTYLALWGRAPREELDVSGDHDAAAALLRSRLTP